MGYLLRGTSPHLPGRTKCRDRANRSRSVHSSRRPRIFSPRLSPIFLFLVTEQTALFLPLSLFLSRFTLLSSFFLFLPLVSVACGNNRLRATLFWPRVQPLRTTRTESYQLASRKPPSFYRSSSAALRLQSLLAADRRAMPAIVKTIISSVYARSREKEVVMRATLPPLYDAFTTGIIRVGFPKLRTSSKLDGRAFWMR